MAPSEKVELELKPSQVKWLESMASKYDLPDASKALRCLVNFAIDNEDTEGDIFDEIRCLDC